MGVGAQGSPHCHQKPEQAPALELTVSQRANTPVPVGQHQRAERPSWRKDSKLGLVGETPPYGALPWGKEMCPQPPASG